MRRRRNRMSDINVVPYIDVCLVLLIIFMVTAPMLTQGVKVDLPKAAAKTMVHQSTPPIIVTVNQRGSLFANIADNPRLSIDRHRLTSLVSGALKRSPGRKVYVKGAAGATYGKVVDAMVLLQQAGAKTVGLITDDDQRKA
jgi:biopolymer transport protein TolR